MRLTGDALAGLALRPFNRPQMAFHQIERCVQACQYLPVQGRLRAVIGISVQRGDDFFMARYAYPAFTDMAPSHLQQMSQGGRSLGWIPSVARTKRLGG